MTNFLSLKGYEQENAYQREARITALRSAIDINSIDRNFIVDTKMLPENTDNLDTDKIIDLMSKTGMMTWSKPFDRLDAVISDADRIYDWLIKDTRNAETK